MREPASPSTFLDVQSTKSTVTNPDFKEWHEENHAAVSTCLRPLINLDLVCQEVSWARCEDTASTFERVKTLVDAAPLHNSEGLMDETMVRFVLSEVFGADEALKADGPTEAELELLLAFVPTDEPMAEAEVRSKATLAATLWCLSRAHRADWLTRVQLPLHKVPLMNALSQINHMELVQASEAMWVQEKFVSLPCDEELEATKLLLCVACWYSKLPLPPGSLNRSLLLDRLQLETKLHVGMRFFFLWATVFVLFSRALIITNKVSACRGIRENVETQLELTEAQQVTSPKEIHSFAVAFSERIANFAPLSKVFFPGDHSWLIQDAPQAFSAPTALPHEMEPDPNTENAPPSSFFIGRSFTMQAWVKVSPLQVFEAHLGLSLLTKSLAVDDSLSCWSWRFPLQLRYGAHDYGPLAVNNITKTFEECIKMDYDMERELRGEVVLHTLLVNETTVTFMVDDNVAGSVELPRAVTDCESTDIKLGDAGLTLASVKFYPHELTKEEVRQIFRTGLTWEEIGRTVHPQRMKESQENEPSWHQEHLDERATASQASAIAASLVATLSQRQGQATVTPYSNNMQEVVEDIDPVLNLPYWSIYREPVYTSLQSNNSAPGTSIPQPEGDRGFTLSSWVKIVPQTRGFLASLAMPMPEAGRKTWRGWPNMCWGIFMSESELLIFAALAQGARNAEEEKHRYKIKTNEKEEWKMRGKAYRHLVFSVDPTNSSRPFRICIDGRCISDGDVEFELQKLEKYPGAPPAANCMQTALARNQSTAWRDDMLNQTRLYLTSRPDYEWQFTGWQMQTKLFDKVLDEDEVYRLFKEDYLSSTSSPKVLPIREEHGCKLYEEAYDDQTWRDAFGKGCLWYRQAKLQSAAVCEGDEVLKNCPTACNVRELCWGETRPHLPTVNIWKRQLFFQPQGKHGTMCVASNTSPENEAVACAEHDQEDPQFCRSFIDNKSALMECLGNTSSWFRGKPTFPCTAIVNSSSPHCTWDPFPQNVSLDEFSLSFWFESAGNRGCLQPNIRFLNSKGTVFARVGAEVDGEDEWDEKINQWRTGCRLDEPFLYLSASNSSDAEVAPPIAWRGEKHLLVLGVSNKEPDGRRLHLIVDHLENKEVLNEGLEADLKVINVQGSVVLSPMQLRAAMLGRTEQSDLLYTREQQAKLVRPVMPLQKQLSQNSTRAIKAYTQRTMLVVPPFMLLQRQKGIDCKPESFGAALDLEDTIQKLGEKVRCHHPYHCPDFRMATLCAEKGVEANDKHFGQYPLDFHHRRYYMEFLATLTSSTIIVREGDGNAGTREMMVTDQFVDSLTSRASVMAIFYSVELGVLTRLQIKFNTEEGRVSSEVLFGHASTTTVAVMIEICTYIGLCALCLLILVGKSIHNLRELKRKRLAEPLDKQHVSIMHMKNFYRKRKFGLEMIDDRFFESIGARSVALLRRHSWFYGDAWGHLFEIVLAVAALAACLLEVLFVVGNNMMIRELLDPVLRFWDEAGPLAAESELGFVRVRQEFLDYLSRFEDSMFYSKVVGSQFFAVISMCVLARVVQTTSDHPRIALITRTLELARSDLMHFCFLMLLVLGGFAVLGTWLFGDKRSDFSNILIAMSTLVDSILGPPGNLPIKPEGDYSVVDVVYVVFFHMVCFLFLLNFVLAIIVDNYAVVVEEVAQCTVEQSYPEDLYDALRYLWLEWYYRFPAKGVIVDYLSRRKLQTVNMEDLFDNSPFREQESAEVFFANYARYSFLRAGSDQGVTSQQALEKTAALMMQKLDVLLERKPSHRFASAAPLPVAEVTL